MRRIALLTTTVLILSVLALGFGCAQPAPAPTPAPAPAPAPKPAPTPAPAPAPAPKPAPTPAPAPPKPVPAPEWPKTLTLTTLWPGATVTVYGTGVAALIEKHLRIPTAPESAKSTVESTMLMLKGESQLCTCNAPNAGYVLMNQPPWPADSSKVFRGITFGGYETHDHWTLLAKSDIKSFSDLKGKRGMVDRKGEPAFEDVWPRILEIYGVPKDSFTASPDLGSKNQAQALKEGRTDVAQHYGAAPVPAIVELETTHPVRVLSHTPDGLKKLLDSLEWVGQPHTIKAGTYKGLEQDALTFKFNLGIGVRRDMPDALVYDIAQAIDQNIAELRVIHPSFKKWTIEDLANSPYAPYHPGALKYYMQKGILTQESIDKHKELLKKCGEES